MTDPGPPLGPPTEGEPAWLPDPTRRHELRWFDGTTFTDHVSDGSFRSTDPGGSFGTTAPATLADLGPGASPVSTDTKTSRMRLVVAGVGIGAVLGGAAYFVVGRDDGSGFGSFEGTVDDEEGTHEISLSGGSVAIVRLDPSPEFDAIVGFRIDDDADRIEDLYARTPYAAEATRRGGEVFRIDIGFEGQPELTFLAVPFDVDATVVVSGFSGSRGDYVVEIEELRIDGLDEDADGEEVLEALADVDELPRTLRDDIEARLDES